MQRLLTSLVAFVQSRSALARRPQDVWFHREQKFFRPSESSEEMSGYARRFLTPITRAQEILIILMDDAGPALPTTYGGEVHTPTQDRVHTTS